MSVTLCVLNQKGGVGKTTLTINIAAMLAVKRRVIAVDADPQGSLRDWRSVRDPDVPAPFEVIGMDRPTLHQDLPKIAGDASVVIDCPQQGERGGKIARSALLASDVVVVPVTPSQLDIWAATETIDLISECQVVKPELRAIVVLNRVQPRTAISKSAYAALRELGVPVSRTTIPQRVAFAESITKGLTINEYGRWVEKRAFQRLTDEVLELENDS